MRLLDKMLARHVQRGELTITDHAGKIWRYGVPDPELRPGGLRRGVEVQAVGVQQPA